MPHTIMLSYRHTVIPSRKTFWHAIIALDHLITMYSCHHVKLFIVSSCRHVIMPSCSLFACRNDIILYYHYVLMTPFQHVTMSSCHACLHVIMSSFRHVISLCLCVIMSLCHHGIMSSNNLFISHNVITFR
jgi:hypothetical protein